MSDEMNGLPKDYRPSEDEPFMNEMQRTYFRKKLLVWREEILRESRETISNLQEEQGNHADLADRASSEADRALELRTRDRQRKLISKIDSALRRVDEGTFRTLYAGASERRFLLSGGKLGGLLELSRSDEDWRVRFHKR